MSISVWYWLHFGISRLAFQHRSDIDDDTDSVPDDGPIYDSLLVVFTAVFITRIQHSDIGPTSAWYRQYTTVKGKGKGEVYSLYLRLHVFYRLHILPSDHWVISRPLTYGAKAHWPSQPWQIDLFPSQVPNYKPGWREAHVGWIFCPEKSDGLGGIPTQDLPIPGPASYH